MIFKTTLFLLANFIALGIGGIFTEKGVSSEWYASLSKAPWTPPGWVFGAAWTTIMVCFAIYMAFALEKVKNKKLLIGLFSLQWVLNVLWNPVFFYYHHALAGMIIIVALTLLITVFLFKYIKDLKLKSILVLPYFIWLLIATSLNWYIFANN